MGYQSTFKRYEIKYLLTPQQKEQVQEAMASYMEPDKYGCTTIRNVYFDTENYRLIRASLEKPVYKEKLRIRSYRQAESDTPVYVELKKKYNGVVYKRRLQMPEQRAMDWISGREEGPDSQIGREIRYFRDFYNDLRPTVFLCYDRVAWYCKSGSDFRVTFDENILCRRRELSLEFPPGGERILDPELTLMELKTSGGIPLWMTQILTRERLFKTSFSKYGTAYQKLIFPEVKGEIFYV